jgi:hypothetical protein
LQIAVKLKINYGREQSSLNAIALSLTDASLRFTVDDLPEHEINPDYALVDDMILAPEQYDIIFNNVTRRTGMMQAVKPWPNATVPYILDNNFSKLRA